VIVGVGVVGDLLTGAHGAGVFTAVNAGVVEVRVEGAEVAAAAVPQRSHLDVRRWWLTGGDGDVDWLAVVLECRWMFKFE
jgi:hypothetical protein